MTKLTEEKIVAMRRLWSEGWEPRSIALAIKVSTPRVMAWIERERADGAPPRALKAVHAARRLGAVEIPRWVPHILRDDYHRIAMTSGEEDAARHARRFKHEMRSGTRA